MPAFGSLKLIEIDATKIEIHLRDRLGQKRHVRRKAGKVSLATLKATTVHQEFRVLRRILSVAVKKKLIPVNPCAAVEFPVMVKGLFRPHYVTSSEQAMFEEHAPAYLRQSDAKVFKKYSKMKLQMKREALAQLNRQAGESAPPKSFDTEAAE